MVTATLELNNTVPDLRRMFQALWFNQSVTLSGTDSGNVVTVTRLWPGYQVVVKSFAGPIAPTVGEALDTAVTVHHDLGDAVRVAVHGLLDLDRLVEPRQGEA